PWMMKPPLVLWSLTETVYRPAFRPVTSFPWNVNFGAPAALTVATSVPRSGSDEVAVPLVLDFDEEPTRLDWTSPLPQPLLVVWLATPLAEPAAVVVNETRATPGWLLSTAT